MPLKKNAVLKQVSEGEAFRLMSHVHYQCLPANWEFERFVDYLEQDPAAVAAAGRRVIAARAPEISVEDLL